MKILLIDTCGTQGSVAIANLGAPHLDFDMWERSGDNAIFSTTLPGRSASEKLIGAIRELTKTSGIALRELNAIAVVNGPGSFTGVRIGLSAAKGLCDALGVPLVAVSRLAVLASLAHAEPRATVFAALDAGRSEFYVGEYRNGEEVREALVSYEEFTALTRESSWPAKVVVCEDNVSSALAALHPLRVAEPDAMTALPLAMSKFQRNDFADLPSIDANYLRRTDLEIFAKTKARADAAAQ